MKSRHSIGKEKAIEFYNTGWWKNKTPKEICDVQLFTEELCMPFDKFHEAFEKCLGRPVFTHEFGLCFDDLVKEYLGEKQAPTLEEIISVLPADKTIVVGM